MSAVLRNHGARRLRYLRFGLEAVAIGALGMAIGAFLAWADPRWEYGIYHSAAGLVGAPFAFLAWATRRYRRGQIFAIIAVLVAFVSGMTMLLELTTDHPSISAAAIGSPIAFSLWFLIWGLWVSLALARLIVIGPRHMRQRLSSHHQ